MSSTAEVAELQRRLAEAELDAAESKRRAAEAAAAREASDRRAEAAERLAAAAVAARSTEAADETVAPVPMEAVQRRYKKVTLASPSKAKGNTRVFRRELCVVLNERPLSLAAPFSPDSLAKAFEAGVFRDDIEPLEAVLYPLATHSVPACVDAQERTPGAKLNAEALYGPRSSFELQERIILPLGCEPELIVKAILQGHPAFAGELKRWPPGMLNEALLYVLLGLLHSSFHVGTIRGRRFHTAPPIGYVLLACGCVGFLLGVEWVGKLFAYSVSQPFFLGSPEHTDAVAALPVTPLRMQDAVVVPHDGGKWCYHPPLGDPVVSWTVEATADGRFWKIIQCDAFDGHPDGGVACIRALYDVHARYAAALDASLPHDPPPPALVRARLMYGAFELLVTMPFVGDRQATFEELAAPRGGVVDAVASAVVWLARHGLLYVDLRPPNVRLGEAGAAWLVDYDDMVPLEPPAQRADDVLRALEANKHGASALAAFPALKDALLRTPWPAVAAVVGEE